VTPEIGTSKRGIERALGATDNPPDGLRDVFLLLPTGDERQISSCLRQ
jgi:hypothetical protein